MVWDGQQHNAMLQPPEVSGPPVRLQSGVASGRARQVDARPAGWRDAPQAWAAGGASVVPGGRQGRQAGAWVRPVQVAVAQGCFTPSTCTTRRTLSLMPKFRPQPMPYWLRAMVVSKSPPQTSTFSIGLV